MIFGFSGTKRTVRNKRCPYYRGVRKERLHCIDVSFPALVALCIYYKNYLTLIMTLLNYVPLNEMGIELQKTKKILNIPKICIFSLSSRSVPVF